MLLNQLMILYFAHSTLCISAPETPPAVGVGVPDGSGDHLGQEGGSGPGPSSGGDVVESDDDYYSKRGVIDPNTGLCAVPAVISPTSPVYVSESG